MPDQPLTHAGGIVLRRGIELEVLLVRARPAPHDWIVPKGHIERPETAEEAARREVAEEAGVDAAVLRYLGMTEFDLPKPEHVRAAYFLMRFVREVPRTEDRAVRWSTRADAMSRVRFADLRSLIAAAFEAFDR